MHDYHIILHLRNVCVCVLDSNSAQIRYKFSENVGCRQAAILMLAATINLLHGFNF